MEQIGYTQSPPPLDAVFMALADPTRRDILARLAKGQASVGELARTVRDEPACGIQTPQGTRTRRADRTPDRQTTPPARLNAAPMAAAVEWLREFEAFWSGSFDQLETLLETMKQADAKGPNND